MYEQGLGVLPVIVTTAVNLLVPAIESLFKSNTRAYSFPDAKNMIDNWAGVVNLDPTLNTANAQWAWANVRCMAGDTAAADDLKTASQLFPLSQLGPFKLRITPDGPVPDNFAPTCTGQHADAEAYALAAVRVLTTRQAQPGTDLYSGTLPSPLPVVVPSQPPVSLAIPTTIGGIPTMYLAAGAVVLLLIARRR